MKKVLTTIIITMCFLFVAKAQYVNIPDSLFRSTLIGIYPTCFDSLERMDTTCGQIVNEDSLSLGNSEIIKNLDGIQYFKKLNVFNCHGALIYAFPKLPESLKIFICTQMYDTLRILAPLPQNLEYFDCSCNYISRLPELPSKLKFLNCSMYLSNFSGTLDSLPTLPNTLQELRCTYNKIKSLPKLPDSLKMLECSINQLKSLPKLPDSLKYLNCYDNQLKSLPQIPNSLKGLHIGSNNITKLPDLPIGLQDLNLYMNPINCLPILPTTIVSLEIDTKMITCLPNFLPLATNFLGYPICSPTSNSNRCQSLAVEKLFAYIDLNNNNKLDSTEFPKHNLKLTISSNNYAYTNSNGIAYLAADSLGTYTITATQPNFYNAVPSSYTHTFTTYDTLVIDTFALQATVLKDSITIKLTPTNFAARPGFAYPYSVSYENVGTTVLSNAIVGLQYDNSLLNYDSSSNNAVTNNGSNLSINVGNLLPGQIGSFYAYFKVKTTAVLNSSFISIANISTNTVAANDTVTTIVRGSYDPNDKQATPSLTTQQVTEGRFIDYTIRFQNTGTDTAFTVVIADTLDSKLQANELQMVGSSHPCKTTVKDNIIFFEFINILLPDSNTNKIGSNGFVSFKIKPISSVASGTTIPNKAAIYFDYNSPIITKPANTIIQNPLPLQLLNFSAIPQKETDKILVYWNTSNEINTSHFIIEQSIDGIAFKAAAEVAAKGTGSNSYFYSIDKNKVAYVRLKMIDKNGMFSYSKIIKINAIVELLDGLIVVKNPTKNQLQLKVNSSSLNNTTASLVNAQGKVVKQFILQQGSQTIDITGFAAGVYYLKTVGGSKKIAVNP